MFSKANMRIHTVSTVCICKSMIQSIWIMQIIWVTHKSGTCQIEHQSTFNMFLCPCTLPLKIKWRLTWDIEHKTFHCWSKCIQNLLNDRNILK